MPDYKDGKIYMIWSPNTDKVYIGSTTQPLHKRFHDHKNSLTGKKYTTAREVLACGEARIELIEDHPCANKAELNAREGQVMRGYDNRVNRCIAGRTPAEYRADNKEQVAERMREYRQQHKEHLEAQRKEYQQRPEVKARRNTQRKEYYQQHKEHLAAQRKEYQQRPEVKARRNALARERWQRKKEQLEM